MKKQILTAAQKTRVLYFDDERSIGNAIIVTLNKGWRFDYHDVSHVQGFDTVSEAKKAINDSRICNCDDCCKQ